MQVNPDISNPMQCNHCFEFGKHIAEDCKVSTPTCEKCSSKEHSVEECNTNKDDFCCHNCQGDHGARDRICPVFSELKINKLNEAYTKITGIVAFRQAP